MSIFIKIFLTIAISTIVFITFFVNYIINIQKEESTDRLNNKIQYHKQINKSTISQLLFDLNKDILITNLTSLYLDQDIAKIELIDYSGVINFKIDDKKYNKFIDKSTIELEVNNEILGELNIYYTNQIIKEKIEEYRNDIIKLSLLLAILLLGIIFYFIRKTTHTIEELTIATNEITSGNLDFDINIQTNDEIGQLANKFNDMRSSLKNRLHIINQQLKFQQLLMQSVNIPIYIIDNKGKYIDCNDAFALFYGMKREQIIGKDISFLIKDEYLKTQTKIDKELFEKGGFKSYITKLSNDKNEIKDLVLYKNIYIDEKTNLAWIIGTYFDITEINKAKEKIEKFNEELKLKVFERTEELEGANDELQNTITNLKEMQEKLIESEKLASLGSLVAGVAHEINTPVGIGLTSITHFLEIVKKLKKSYEEDSMTEEGFESFINTSFELATLTNSNLERTAHLIKSFKQISVDQTSEETREFNLKKYLEEILFSISNITKKAKISVKIEADNNINIHSYPGALSQIITNLVINSDTHAFENTINKSISIKVAHKDDQIKIIYKDNGSGIKKENLEKIFQPFFTTNRQKGNTGLGLNIIYNIVTTTLGGSIICNSEEKQGVEFIIIFKV